MKSEKKTKQTNKQTYSGRRIQSIKLQQDSIEVGVILEFKM